MTYSENRKISILLPDLRGGGVERMRLVLAKEFSREGFQIEIVVMRRSGDLLLEAEKSFKVVDLKCQRARSLPFALAEYLKNNSIDGLLVAMWPVTVLAPLVKLLGYKGPIVASEHNTLSVQYNAWGKLHRLAMRVSMLIGYRMVSKRVAVSQGVARDMAKLACMKEGQVEVIHNPLRHLPKESDTNNQIVEALWENSSALRFLNVGSFKSQKNQSLLLRSFSRMLRESGRTDAKLMLVGSGPLEIKLKEEAELLGISENIIFAGFQSDPFPFYQSADCFVLTSDYEGFGNVVVEALASGTPVIATDCPSGPSDILCGGEFGKLIPVGDEFALAEALIGFSHLDFDPIVLRQRARSFSPEYAARRYLELIFPDRLGSG